MQKEATEALRLGRASGVLFIKTGTGPGGASVGLAKAHLLDFQLEGWFSMKRSHVSRWPH